MFDEEIVLDSLKKIRGTIDLILERASHVENPNDLLCSPGGMLAETVQRPSRGRKSVFGCKVLRAL